MFWMASLENRNSNNFHWERFWKLFSGVFGFAVVAFAVVLAVAVTWKLVSQYFVTYNRYFAMSFVVVGTTSNDILCCGFFLVVIFIFTEEWFWNPTTPVM